MAKKISTSIRIEAAPSVVWQVLTDFAAYPRWNPFIKSIKGDVTVNKKIYIQLPGIQFKPKVLAFDPQNEIRWLGHLIIKGLFDGEHSFRLVDNGDGSTNFIHSEEFKGFLVPFLAGKLDKETKTGFEQMNRALKQRAEQSLR